MHILIVEDETKIAEFLAKGLNESGYLSSTHKHADDLSFVLYTKGHDIFIDPGMFNYMTGNEVHDYLISALAHNTVTVDELTYSVSMSNSSKVGLYEYKKEDGYETYDQ